MYRELAQRPAVWLAAAFLMGIASAIGNWWWVALPALLIAVWDLRRTFFILAAFGIGFWHRPGIEPPRFETGGFAGTAKIISVPVARAGKVHCLGSIGPSRYLLTFTEPGDIALGDQVKLIGQVQPVSEFAGFSKGAVAQVIAGPPQLVRRGPPVARWGTYVAQSFSKASAGHLRPPEAALTDAVVLNRTEGLDLNDWEQFRRFGVVHLLSASGFHVFVVAGLLFALVRLVPLPRHWQIALVAIALVFFACAAGMRPPIIRAVVMSLIVSTAYLWRREPDALSALGIATIVTLAADPFAVAELGLHLSLLSTLALALVFDRARGSQPRTALAASAAAMSATLPVTAYAFGEISVVALLGNLLVSPIVAAFVTTSLLAWLMGFVFPPLGDLMWLLVEPLARLTVTLNSIGSSLPGSQVFVPGFSPLLTVILTLFGFSLIAARAPHRWVMGGITILAAIYEWMIHRPVDFVAFLQVGQGDCTVIRSNNQVLVVDAGPRYEGFDSGSRIIWPRLRHFGIREIDVLVLTHPDLDHIGGMVALSARVPIRELVVPARFRKNDALGAELDAAHFYRVHWVDSPGYDASRALLLAPGAVDGDENDGSMLVRAQVGQERLVLTGDASSRVENGWLDLALGHCEIVKAGHHGSKSSLSSEWLKGMRPQLVAFSCGRNNRYGHPSREALARATAVGAEIWRTDRDGDLVLRPAPSGLLRPAGPESFDPLFHFFNR